MKLGIACLFACLVVACGGDDTPAQPDAKVPTPDGEAIVCSPATCSDGCCSNGICQSGDTASACGTGGATCAVCSSGEACTELVDHCVNASDPCQGVGQTGVCASPTSVAFCSASTGNGGTELSTYACQTGEQCQQTSDGARCVLTAACSDGDAQCLDASTIRTCQGGSWTTSSCSRQCIGSPLGDFCGINESTQTLTGTLRYEAKGPNSIPPTNWGPLTSVPAPGFLVVVVRFEPSGPRFIDSKLTTAGGANSGSFSVLVPAVPQATDYIMFMAVGTAPHPMTGKPTIAYAIADPGLAPSATPYAIGSLGAMPRVWSWSIQVSAVAQGSTVTITDSIFSGAARVLDYARYVHGLNQQRFNGFDPFVVWMAPGVQWNCGACAWGVPTYQFGTYFPTQLFIRGGPDEGYWSDPVTAHELGHWTMGAFGRAVGEGGPHCVGVASSPGLSWSEGYATWFSSDARSSPLYYDKQCSGSTCSMFWFDVSQRSSSGSPWPAPTASAGLLQDIYENEVAAMMWNISATQGLGRAPFDAALTSPRMTVPPFERGYTVHGWNVEPNTCQRTNVQDLGVPTVVFADFLDQLRCSGVSANVINAATNPTVNYPYPSGAPLCR